MLGLYSIDIIPHTLICVADAFETPWMSLPWTCMDAVCIGKAIILCRYLKQPLPWLGCINNVRIFLSVKCRCQW